MKNLALIIIGLLLILFYFSISEPEIKLDTEDSIDKIGLTNLTSTKNASFKRTHEKKNLSPLQKAQNEVARLGLAQSIEDLYTPLDDEDNAAALLQEIFTLMEDKNGSAYKLADIDFEKLNPEERQKLWRSLQDPGIQKILALTSEAALKEGADFKLKYKDGPAMILPQLGKMRQLTKLLTHATQLKTEFESADESFNTLKASLKMAEFSADGLTIIGNLVEQACHKITLKAIPTNLNQANRQELFNLLQDNYSSSLEKHQKSIDGERVVFGSYFPKIPQMITNDPGLLGDIELSPNYSIEDEQAFYTESLLLYRELSNQEYYKSKNQIQQWDQELTSKLNEYPINSMILPSLSPAIKKSYATQTQTQMAMIQLKIQDYKEMNGHTPNSLQDLNLPTHLIQDTFTGDPLIYEQVDGKTKISSQGKVRDKEISLEF